MSLKLFSHPTILKQIGHPRLALFFARFTADLQAAHIVLPEFCPSNDEYFVALAGLLVSPTFPARPRETLARLEFLAASESVSHLEAAITRHIPHISLHHTQPVIDRALELWFHDPGAITDLFVALHPDFNEPPEPKSPSGQVLIGVTNTESPTQNLKSIIKNDLVPWPESVNLKTLLDHLVHLLKRLVILPQWAAETLALWIVHTYAFHLRDVSTYIGIESPEPRCGKTTLLTVLNEVAWRALASSNISPPAFFRVIEDLSPTLLIDEADTFLHRNEQLQGILNSGYTRKTAFVLRVGPALNEEENSENSTGTVNRFSCWCPKVISQIGRLPATLADRCIIIRMQRKTPDEKCDRLRTLDVADFKRQCLRYVQDHSQEISSARPDHPATLSDRAADIWEPLFVLADLAGPPWANQARQAAVGLATATQESNPFASLLVDIFLIFCLHKADRMFTRQLLDQLNAFTDRPWAEALKGKPINEYWLSHRLRPYGIRSKTLWMENSSAKGYLRDDFIEIWRRYVPRSEFDAWLGRDGKPETPAGENDETATGEAA